jgi:hypothetical protein
MLLLSTVLVTHGAVGRTRLQKRESVSEHDHHTNLAYRDEINVQQRHLPEQPGSSRHSHQWRQNPPPYAHAESWSPF